MFLYGKNSLYQIRTNEILYIYEDDIKYIIYLNFSGNESVISFTKNDSFYSTNNKTLERFAKLKGHKCIYYINLDEIKQIYYEDKIVYIRYENIISSKLLQPITEEAFNEFLINTTIKE